MAFPAPLYTMKEVVATICHATGIPDKLAYHRFRNWVNYNWIIGQYRTGKGKGTRRKYAKGAIIQTVIMLHVSQYLEGKFLPWVAIKVQAHLGYLEKMMADPGERCWMLIDNTQKEFELSNVNIVGFDATQKGAAGI